MIDKVSGRVSYNVTSVDKAKIDGAPKYSTEDSLELS
jgi:hypothetical protein